MDVVVVVVSGEVVMVVSAKKVFRECDGMFGGCVTPVDAEPC